MRTIRFAFGLALAALLLAPAVALAQLSVNPDRLNGSFDFRDKVELDANTLEFQVEGREIGMEGQVRDLAGDNVVTISYRTGFPSKSSAGEQDASVAQDRQVLVTLEVLEVGNPTPIYLGQAAPVKCKADAKIRDGEANDPDDPDKAQAKLTCDLGNDWDELEDGLAAPPSSTVLEAVEAAFEARKDVKVDTSKGKLQIKHNGEPVLVP
jgi:hypothetical protein